MASYQTDPHYPCYHLRAREEAVNDPCGAIWWGDEYHLFYQWNARWVHAASSDLVHWRHFPIALVPTPDSCDKGGCWSGAVGEVAVFAKGGRALLQRLDAWSLVKALPTGDPGDT